MPRCVDSNGHCHQWKQKGECERNPDFMHASCMRSCGACDGWDWIFDLRLGSLQKTLACWRLPADSARPPRDCSRASDWPPAHKLSSRADLRALPKRVKQWLLRVATARGAEHVRALRAAFAYDAPPPAAQTVRVPPKGPPPAPPPLPPATGPRLPAPSERPLPERLLRARERAAAAAGRPPSLPPLPPSPSKPTRKDPAPGEARAGRTQHDEL